MPENQVKKNINSTPNICIVQPNKNLYSETFIHNHFKYLNGNKYCLHGPWFPVMWEEVNICNKYLSINFMARLFRTLLKILPVFVFNRLNPVLRGEKTDLRVQRTAFENFLKKKKIDVVLAEYGVKGGIVAESCEKLNIPLVVHFHGQDAHKKELLKVHQERYHKMFNIAKAIIVVSNKMEIALIAMGAPKSKLHLIPYGVDTIKFKGEQRSDKISNKFVSVGRFTDKKAPILTILAFNMAIQVKASLKLIMFGDGPLMESCISLVKALKIESAVDIRGSVQHDEVSREMADADGFILHSVTSSDGNSEGTPNVILEAAATGLTIISTKHAGIQDVIQHGFNGLLVEERDIEKMSEYILKVIEDKNFALELGENARQTISKNYDLFKQLEKLDAILENVCAG